MSSTTEIDPVPADAPPRRHPGIALLRKVAVGVAGIALIGAGVAMLVLPGPGILAIFAGLAVLSTEFKAAKRVNDWARARFHEQWTKVRSRAGKSKPDH
ncbi:PGPGW domain-containing protein [Spirillospora sp. NPDC047279]|uniref:PGPGW domain-containing protein n=1 Tax=Spirillospora sp. NPDC047279 TaxID=3155478 RepID=UPI0033C622ED